MSSCHNYKKEKLENASVARLSSHPLATALVAGLSGEFECTGFYLRICPSLLWSFLFEYRLHHQLGIH